VKSRGEDKEKISTADCVKLFGKYKRKRGVREEYCQHNECGAGGKKRHQEQRNTGRVGRIRKEVRGDSRPNRKIRHGSPPEED